jgi:hypothetical protein
MDPSHKELLVGLIGSTYGELKRLDDSIVGTSSTLNRRSDEAKRELTNVLKGIQSKPDVPVLQHIRESSPVATMASVPAGDQQYQPAIAPAQSYQVSARPSPQAAEGQLELDFNRAAKYDDVIDAIIALKEQINVISTKIDMLNMNQIPKKVTTNTPKKNRGM